MKIASTLHTVSLVVAVTLSAGCAQVSYRYYQGSPKPREELAILHTSMEDPACIRSIDGRPFSYAKILARVNIDSPFIIELLPGIHDIVVFFSTYSSLHAYLVSTNDLTLLTELKAGHDYHFTAEITYTDVAGRTQRVWHPAIVDEEKPAQ